MAKTKLPVVMVHVATGAETTVETMLELNNLAVNGYKVQTEKKSKSAATSRSSASSSSKSDKSSGTKSDSSSDDTSTTNTADNTSTDTGSSATQA